MPQNNNFYALRYSRTVEVLRENGLWDLEYGLAFLPIIQYCMPEPSINKIKELIENLQAVKVDTDWAPFEITKQLKDKLKNKDDSLPLPLPLPDNDNDNTKAKAKAEKKRQGRDYAIAYGINRIAAQKDWTTELRSKVIIEFVETLYSKLAPTKELNANELYKDTYQLRDVLLYQAATNNGLGLYGSQTTSDINDKIEHIEEIFNGMRLVGSKTNYSNEPSRFWDNAPDELFTFVVNQPKVTGTQGRGNSGIDNDPLDQPTDDADHSSTNDQQDLNLFSVRPKWVHNNVRSLANGSQLSWHSILQYWEFLLESEKREQFMLSFISFLIGIPKKRWSNVADLNTLLHLDNIVIDERKNRVIYKIKSGANNISKDEAAELVVIDLPENIKLTIQDVQEGIKEENSVRAFNRRHSGPRPMLNTVARSGHVLLRKNIKGESLAFLLSGTTPIEFTARSAYIETSNLELNKLFQACLVKLLDIIKSKKLQHPKLSSVTGTFKTQKNVEREHLIGSQLASANWNFSSFSIPAYSGKNIARKVEVLNHLSLYYFWMAQFAMATRASGELTETINVSDFRFHKDKDSKDYIEEKILLLPELLKAQEKELNECLYSVKRYADKTKYSMTDSKIDDYAHYYYKALKKKKTIVTSPLLSNKALQLSKKYWGISPLHDRSNAHRHQCATYIHQRLSETHADAWLGHRIDGWYFSSPESSSTIQMLYEVLNIQEEWLKELGFRLIKNPLI